MSDAQVTVTPTGEEEIDRRTFGDVFGSQRWVWGGAAIVVILVIGGVALWLRSTGGVDPEPGSSAFILPAEDGTSVRVLRTTVPESQVQIASQGGRSPQTVVVLDDDVFVAGQSTLAPGADAELERVLAAVRISGDEVADVVGYTDATQPDRAFLPLSRARADTVADWLVQQGEGTRRLDVDWRGTQGAAGETSPGQAPDGTIERPVEVRIDVPDLGVGAPPASGLGSDQDPVGVALAVDRVSVSPTAIVLDVRFSNPAPYPVQFNADGMWLVDDRGTTYRFVPPAQNPDLAVPAESSLSGQLAFPGVVTPGASRVTLLTNTADPREELQDALQSVVDVLEALVEAGATTEEILSEAGTVDEIDAARDSLIDGDGYEEPEPVFLVGDIPLPR